MRDCAETIQLNGAFISVYGLREMISMLRLSRDELLLCTTFEQPAPWPRGRVEDAKRTLGMYPIKPVPADTLPRPVAYKFETSDFYWNADDVDAHLAKLEAEKAKEASARFIARVERDARDDPLGAGPL